MGYLTSEHFRHVIVETRLVVYLFLRT